MRRTLQFGVWRRSIVDAAMNPLTLRPLFQSLTFICSHAAGNEELSIRLEDRQDSVVKKMGHCCASGFRREKYEIGWVTKNNSSTLSVLLCYVQTIVVLKLDKLSLKKLMDGLLVDCTIISCGSLKSKRSAGLFRTLG
jgi:hypothetical protein